MHIKIIENYLIFMFESQMIRNEMKESNYYKEVACVPFDIELNELLVVSCVYLFELSVQQFY